MSAIFVDQEFRFANGYGASVIHDPRDRTKAEIIVTNSRGEFVYDSGITQDVLAGVDPIDIDRVLDQIASLPLRPSDAPSGEATRPHKRHPAPLSAIRMPAGTHLAYHLPHEARYWRANRDRYQDRRQVGVTASAQGQGGGAAWEFYLVEYLLGGKPALRLKMFADSWSALAEIAPFFADLAAGSVKTLDDVVRLLNELGAVDETER